MARTTRNSHERPSVKRSGAAAQPALLTDLVPQAVIEAIRRAKTEWEAVFDAVHDLIVIVDHEGRIVRCNRAVVDKLATTYGNVLGRSLGEVFLGGESGAVGNIFSEVGANTVGDVHFPRLGGWFTVSGYDTRQVDRESPGRVWVMTEVTARKAMEAERSLMVAAIENADEGMMILGADGKNRYTNAAFERITGWTSSEPDAKEPLEWLEEFGRESGLVPFREAIEGGQRWRGNFKLSFPAEPARDFNAGVWPIRDSSGGIAGTVALLTDVTEALAARHREVRMRELARMGWLVGGVAHEVRNPLYTIQAVIQALQADLGGSPENATLLEIAVGHVERLSTMMKELLELGKPIARTTMSFVALAPFCRRVLEAWMESHPSIPADSVRLSIGIDDDAEVLVDSDRLSQVVFNLLDNAVQASNSEVTIGVDVMGGDRECRILVADRGRGVPEEHLASVFEPFFTLRRGGTGLGLSIVKHVVEEHGGIVALRSNSPLPGCTAEVCLPRAHSRDVRVPKAGRRAVEPRAPDGSPCVGREN